MAHSNSKAPETVPHQQVSWFALTAPVLAWFSQHLVNYYTSSVACDYHRPGLARALVIGVDLVALGVSVSAGIAGYRSFRRIAGKAHLGEDEARDHDELLAVMSVFLGVIGTVGIFWGLWPALLLSNVCGARQ
jgi:hypothetical protein